MTFERDVSEALKALDEQQEIVTDGLLDLRKNIIGLGIRIKTLEEGKK